MSSMSRKPVSSAAMPAGVKKSWKGSPAPSTRAASESWASLFEGRENRTRLSVIENHAAAGRLRADEFESRPEGVQGQVRNDAQPGEEGGDPLVEARGQKLRAKGFSLEVDRRKGKALGNWDAALAKQVPLPLLGGGVIDLKDAQLGKGFR